MRRKTLQILLVILGLMVVVSGCTRKVDSERSVDKIKKDIETMSVAQLEDYAMAYVSEIQSQRAKIQKIQEKIRKIPIEKFFSDQALQNDIKKVGRKAEALYVRYLLYVTALKQKGGDVSRVQLNPV
jgi:PBP1b-binding outer membrane lipoprotein LpoB